MRSAFLAVGLIAGAWLAAPMLVNGAAGGHVTESQKSLGAKFDVRAFHDEVLGEGALPLNVLEERVTKWIDSQAKGVPTAH